VNGTNKPTNRVDLSWIQDLARELGHEPPQLGDPLPKLMVEPLAELKAIATARAGSES